MRKLTLKDAQKLAGKHGGACLSEEYTNNYTKMLWECEFKHQWKTVYGNIQQGQWCPECIKNTLQDAQKLAEKKKGRCLSTEYINNYTKMLWECEREHQWEATYHGIYQDHWCSKCDTEKSKNTLQDAQKLAEKKNGKCLSTKYISCMTKMLWECEKEHQWEATYNNTKRDRWCPYCNTNKTQKKLTEILQELIKEDSITIRPEWLKNLNTSRNLEIDIYFPEHKIAVEYNGRQHYEPVDFAGRGEKWAKQNLKIIQERDKIKYELIEQNPDKVKHFIIFTYKNTIEEENVKNILIKRGIIK